MSHELRTPLNAVLGLRAAARARATSTEAAARAVDADPQGRRSHLLDLINEVLDIARIETGNLALSLEPVGVAEIVDDVLD